MRHIDLIVIHCAATPNGVFITPEQIDAWHGKPPHNFRRDPKFAKDFRPHLLHIGYHRLILTSGDEAFGRDIEEVGAHVAGKNANSIGVCMVGTSAFFLSQWDRLKVCLSALAIRMAQRERWEVPPQWYPFPNPAQTMTIFRALGIKVTGHRDLSPDRNGDGKVSPNEWLKVCPGFDVAKWIEKGMTPEPGHVLDDHPAVSSPSSVTRAVSGLRWGTP